MYFLSNTFNKALFFSALTHSVERVETYLEYLSANIFDSNYLNCHDHTRTFQRQVVNDICFRCFFFSPKIKVREAVIICLKTHKQAQITHKPNVTFQKLEIAYIQA